MNVFASADVREESSEVGLVPLKGGQLRLPGVGVVLLALLSAVMLAAAILILLSPRQTPTIQPMPPAQS
ncbi:hypothetical protein AB0D34_08135 [Streptomyces sp. NPDC048420]|uniref:hypothetical protein n=1 Tax=Streptomyces sp. NPDC048420 TaxID=3155755 RepID=UPI0034411378